MIDEINIINILNFLIDKNVKLQIYQYS